MTRVGFEPTPSYEDEKTCKAGKLSQLESHAIDRSAILPLKERRSGDLYERVALVSLEVLVCGDTQTQMAETPTRRSKRFQPLVTHTHPNTWSSRDASTFWASQPCHTRPSIPDDYEVLREDEPSWIPIQGTHTVFYTSFARLRPSAKPGSRRTIESKTNSKRKSNTTVCEEREREVFSVGDTVCIETELASRGNSVAVIVSMWELTTDPEEDMDHQPGPPMFVRVHWFERPFELPSIRPKREHYEVCTKSAFTSSWSSGLRTTERSVLYSRSTRRPSHIQNSLSMYCI